MSDVLHDGIAADRSLDSFDASPAAAVLLYAKDPATPGKARALSLGDLAGSPAGAAAAPGEHLDARAIYATGYTPAVDGTLLIQNLCRTCYFEGYPGTPAPISSEPAGYPSISVAPEHWAAVPVRGGQAFAIFMNGNAEPDHFDEVAVVFLPGASQIGGGEMPRHPLGPFAPQQIPVGPTGALLPTPGGAGRALVTVLSGTVRMSLGDATVAPEYTAGDSLQLDTVEEMVYLHLASDDNGVVHAQFWAGR